MWSTPEMTVAAAEPGEVRDGQRSRPSARPPMAFRSLVAVLALSAAAFNIALMLSDRAPGLSRRVFGGVAGGVLDSLRRSEVVRSLTEGRNPGYDALVHIAVWAVAMGLVGLALWRWTPLFIAASVLFVSSVVIEFAQGRFSSSRDVELSDVISNAVGVMLGVAACSACYAAWSRFAARDRSRHTEA